MGWMLAPLRAALISLACLGAGLPPAAAQQGGGNVVALTRQLEQQVRADSFAAAINTWQALQPLLPADRPWPSALLWTLNELGRGLHDARQFDQAEALFRQLIPRWRALADPTDLGFAVTLNNLAILLQATGRGADGVAMLGEAIERAETAAGPRDPFPLTLLATQATMLRLQGRFAEAAAVQRGLLPRRREVLGARHADTLATLEALGELLRLLGDPAQAEPLYREALALREATGGPSNLATLIAMNELAHVLMDRNAMREAEALLLEILARGEPALGPRHQLIVVVRGNLAALLVRQRRYAEAEPRLVEALALARQVLGPDSPNTLGMQHNLASVYSATQRAYAAEPLLRDALARLRARSGPAHAETLAVTEALVNMLQFQRRRAEALPLAQEALRGRVMLHGPDHPRTITSANILVVLLFEAGRIADAAYLGEQVLARARAALGPRHATTVAAINNLAMAYRDSGRLREGEALAVEALAAARAIDGEFAVSTVNALNNLAALLAAQGRREEAAPLYAAARETAERGLGPLDPLRLRVQVNEALNLGALGRFEEAATRLRIAGEGGLGRLGTDLHATAAPAARRAAVAAQASYLDGVLSLALMPRAGRSAAEVAAFAAMSLKGVRGEGDAELARLLRRATEPAVRDLAVGMVAMRSELASLHHAGAPPARIAALAGEIDRREGELARLSRDYAAGIALRAAPVQAIQARLGPREALLEIREFRPVDFAISQYGPRRWAGILLRRDSVEVIDLGPVEATGEAMRVMTAGMGGEVERRAARAAFDQVLAPVVAGLERVYVAPDGALQLLPFTALLAPDGRRVAEMLDLRVMLSGRDMLHEAPERPARGLLALGGVDFDAVGGGAAQPTVLAELASTDTLRSATAGALGHGFRFLPGSAREVAEIAALYRAARPGESVDLLTGAAASEAALTGRPAPRVLHLATHGFYLPATVDEDRPLLLSGIALAGANRALAATGQDGILYAIEAQDLDLEGTELVVLSACETAQGQVEYGEGVAGLVRALRTAGARHVLATLRPVEDQAALAFMRRFYRRYLAQATPDPAAALRAAQIEAMREAGEAGGPDRGLGRPAGGGDAVWAQFVLFGG